MPRSRSILRKLLRYRLARRLLLVIAVFLAIGALTAWQRLRTGQALAERDRQEFQALAYHAAIRHGVDPCLVMGVIQTESAWRPDATGKAGEVGLMQIMPGVVSDWERITGGRAGPRGQHFAPELNIEIGTWYLARACERWEDHTPPTYWALLQYNAGPTRATELAATHTEIELDDIPITSTRAYIVKVTKNRDHFRKAGLCQSPPPTTHHQTNR